MVAGGQLTRRFRASALVLFAIVLGLGSVNGAAYAAGPRPDPPPVKPPPPPPAPRPAPPAPPPAAVPPPVVLQPPPAAVQPPASGPSAAEVLAAQRAAARAKAQQKAERLRKQRRAARRQRAAARRAAREKASARRLADARRESTKTAGGGGIAVNGSLREAVPVAAATLVALLMLGLGFVPAYVVSRNRFTAVLEDYRGDITLVGGLALLTAAVYFALTFLS